MVRVAPVTSPLSAGRNRAWVTGRPSRACAIETILVSSGVRVEIESRISLPVLHIATLGWLRSRMTTLVASTWYQGTEPLAPGTAGVPVGDDTVRLKYVA